MKRLDLPLLLLTASLVLILPARSQESSKANPGLKELYQFGLLVRGPTWTPERTPRTDSIQAGHMANIGRMAQTGKLLGAGPFLEDGPLRGVFIFKADSMGEARALAAPDPAIATGRLELRLHTWLGPKGIGEKYRQRAKLRPDKPDSMITLTLALLERGPRFDALALDEMTRIEKAHRAYVDKLLLGTKLMATGPIQGGGDLRRVYVFGPDSAAARALLREDPAVRAGRYTFEIHPWMTAWGVIP
jgi:uncharacterized protein YciI